jgi:hypothetical protein
VVKSATDANRPIGDDAQTWNDSIVTAAHILDRRNHPDIDGALVQEAAHFEGTSKRSENRSVLSSSPYTSGRAFR